MRHYHSLILFGILAQKSGAFKLGYHHRNAIVGGASGGVGGGVFLSRPSGGGCGTGASRDLTVVCLIGAGFSRGERRIPGAFREDVEGVNQGLESSNGGAGWNDSNSRRGRRASPLSVASKDIEKATDTSSTSAGIKVTDDPTLDDDRTGAVAGRGRSDATLPEDEVDQTQRPQERPLLEYRPCSQCAGLVPRQQMVRCSFCSIGLLCEECHGRYHSWGSGRCRRQLAGTVVTSPIDGGAEPSQATGGASPRGTPRRRLRQKTSCESPVSPRGVSPLVSGRGDGSGVGAVHAAAIATGSDAHAEGGWLGAGRRDGKGQGRGRGAAGCDRAAAAEAGQQPRRRSARIAARMASGGEEIRARDAGDEGVGSVGSGLEELGRRRGKGGSGRGGGGRSRGRGAAG